MKNKIQSITMFLIGYLILVGFITLILTGCTTNYKPQQQHDTYIDYNKGSVFKDNIQRENIK